MFIRLESPFPLDLFGLIFCIKEKQETTDYIVTFSKGPRTF